MSDLFELNLINYIRGNSDYDESVITRISNANKTPKLYNLVKSMVELSECGDNDVKTKLQLNKKIKEQQIELDLVPVKIVPEKTKSVKVAKPVKSVKEVKVKVVETPVAKPDIVEKLSTCVISPFEARFKEVANLDGDLTVYPLDESNPAHHLQVKTNKEKSDEHGEVFTPLWLVDKMIGQAELNSENRLRDTLDLCSGYGQFSIRLMRANYNAGYLCNDEQVEYFLKHTHNFAEFQLSSCYKLLYIFGFDINLYIGDARNLPELKDTDKGIMLYTYAGVWINITESIDEVPRNAPCYTLENEELFINVLNSLGNCTH